MPTAREMKPMIVEAVREVIREEICTRLDNLEQQILDIITIKQQLTEQENTISNIEQSLEFTSSQKRDLNEKIIPDLNKKYNDLITKMCLNTFNLDTHRRKWTLIINGLKGDAGEPELVTRTKVRELAKHKLKIQGVDSHAFTACHRLSQSEDAGVILCFQDLYNRNEWLLKKN